MSLEISALMGAANEEEWERVGLFSTVDKLCMNTSGGGNLNEPLIHEVNDRSFKLRLESF
jgi:hypothetical protein